MILDPLVKEENKEVEEWDVNATPLPLEKPAEERDVNDLLEEYENLDDVIKSLVIQKVDSRTSVQERRMTTTIKEVEEE